MRVISKTLVLIVASSITAELAIAATYTVSLLNVPGLTNPVATGINNHGDIVGFGINSNKIYSAFLLRGDTVATFSVPGSTGTYAYGLNDHDQIVGVFFDSKGTHGFVDDTCRMAGHLRNKFKTIDAPSVPLGSTFANGINNSGQVVGTVSTELSTTGFLDDAGSFTTFQYPGTLTYASAINNSGQITGFIQAFGINEEGFLYNDSTFTIAVIPANSASYTVFSAINSSGQALANVSGPPNIPSGIYLWDKGISTQVPLSITGATQIYANGLNDRGQIVGYYTDSSQRFHPFLATPAAVSDVEFDNFSCACKVQ